LDAVLPSVDIEGEKLLASLAVRKGSLAVNSVSEAILERG